MSFRGIIGDIRETSRCESVEFEWKLGNFFSLSEVVGDRYHSPAFSIWNRSFYLQLYPNENYKKSKGWISLYLVLRQTCPVMNFQYSLAIKKADGKTELLVSVNRDFRKKFDAWGTDKALKRAELLRRREELTSSDAFIITATFKTDVLHPVEDSAIPAVGTLRKGRCTLFCKELFWEIDDAVRRLDEKESFACWSPPYAFDTQLGKMRLCINDDRTEIGLFMPSSVVGYLRWRAGILRADRKEEWTVSGQTLLHEERPGKDPIVAWFGPSRSELIRRKDALISGGVLTFSVQFSTQKAEEDSEIPIVGKIREGHCTKFCKEMFWEIDDAVCRLDENEDFACWSPSYMFFIQQGMMFLCFKYDRSKIYLHISSSSIPLRLVGYLRWRVGILYADGKEEWTGSGETLLQDDRPHKDPFGAWFGPSRSQLIRQKDALISGGVLTFSVQISTQETVEGVTGMSVIKTVKASVAENSCQELQPPEMTDLTTLSRSLKDLYVAGKGCDVSLKVKEKTFGAHRLILGARTPVLAAMFSSNMVEAESGVVRVEDCHPEAFQVFLLFVYSGVAEDLTSENAPDVYYIADKYDLPPLKEVCVRYMLSTLAVDSVCIILALASRHEEEVLLKKATEFFVQNAQAIFLTVAWRNFMMENIDLANELIIQSHKNVK